MYYPSLAVAAFIAFGIGVVHSWLGEHRLIGPLLAPEKRCGMLAKSDLARNVLRFAWHLTTLAWWGFAAILAMLAYQPSDGTGRMVLIATACMFLLSGLIVLIAGRGRHLAWPFFLAVGILALRPLF